MGSISIIEPGDTLNTVIKLNKATVFLLFILDLLTVSCGMQKFAAGSYPYAERIRIDCPGDSIVKRLIILKSTGRYSYSDFYADGAGKENSPWYDFYFYSRERKFLLHLNVITHTPKAATISLINIKDFSTNTDDQWLEINRHVSADKKQEVMSWFEKEIRPAIDCSK